VLNTSEFAQLRDVNQVTLGILVSLVHELHLQGWIDLNRLTKLTLVQLTRMAPGGEESPEAYGQLRLPVFVEGNEAVGDNELLCPQIPIEFPWKGGETNVEDDASPGEAGGGVDASQQYLGGDRELPPGAGRGGAGGACHPEPAATGKAGTLPGSGE